jgi:glycerol-3-phosphate dehydrogenase subunit B
MKDFSARQVAATLSSRWPGLRSLRIPFPGAENLPEVSTEYLARCLDSADCRARLAALILPHVRDAEAVALPPMLGFRQGTLVVSDLKKRLGTLLFEVPSLPVSVPGLRLERAFDRALRALGVQRFPKRVDRVDRGAGGDFEIRAGSTEARIVFRAKAVVLASGRFLGGGLEADRDRVRETVFDLPVHQPARRSLWHLPQMLDPRGHAVNQAGIEVDASFRPLGSDGAPAFPNLFAAGSVLAHQDWMRMKCGSGLSIATAYGAVEACLDFARSRGES